MSQAAHLPFSTLVSLQGIAEATEFHALGSDLAVHDLTQTRLEDSHKQACQR